MGRMIILYIFGSYVGISLGQAENRHWTTIVSFQFHCYIWLCHSVRLINPVNGNWLHILAKFDATFNFGSTVVAICLKWGQSVNSHSLCTIRTILSSYLCIIC